MEKLLLSNEKMTTPEENLDSKNSARKRRTTDLNSSQILQLPQTPISKKTKQVQSSSKAAPKSSLVNRVVLDQIVSEEPH